MIKEWFVQRIKEALNEARRDGLQDEEDYRPENYDYKITKADNGWIFRSYPRRGTNAKEEVVVFKELGQMEDYLKTRWVRDQMGV